MKKHPRFSHQKPDVIKNQLRFSYETLKVLDPDRLTHAAAGGCPGGDTVSNNPDVSQGAC